MPEGSVFNLLIAAVAFAIVLGLVYAVFLPLMEQPSDLGKEISEGFKNAKVREGIVSEGKLLRLEAQQSITPKAFESNDTLAVFECNNPTICCIDTSSCGESELEIQNATRTFSVNEDISVKAFYRCMYSHNLYVCRAFFGMKPAQAEISGINAPAGIELSKSNKLKFSIDYKNSGELDMLSPLEVTVQAFDAKDRNPARLALYESSSEIAGIDAGDRNAASIEIALGNAGSFDIKVRIESEESGFDENSFRITATGVPMTDCFSAAKADTFVYSQEGSIEELRGKCVSKSLCDKCETSMECRNAWLSRAGTVVEASADYAYVVEQMSKCDEIQASAPAAAEPPAPPGPNTEPPPAANPEPQLPQTCFADDPTCNTLTQH